MIAKKELSKGAKLQFEQFDKCSTNFFFHKFFMSVSFCNPCPPFLSTLVLFRDFIHFFLLLYRVHVTSFSVFQVQRIVEACVAK